MKEIQIRPSSHTHYRWEVTAPASLTGQRIRKRFKTKPEATAYSRDLLARLSRYGSDAPSKEELLLLARYRGKLTLQDMETAFQQALAQREQSMASVSFLLSEFQDHMDHARQREAIGELHHRDIDARVPHITKALGHLTLPELSKEHIQDWIDSIDGAPRTKVNYLRMLRQAINFGLNNGLLAKDPSKDVFCPAHKPTVEIVTPDQLSTLLASAHDLADPLTFWWLVFGAFTGLRTSEVERLDWSDVRPDEGHLYVSPGKTDNAERWVNFTPPLLDMNWSLKPAAGPVLLNTHDRTRQVHRQRVYARAGIAVPRNALRHSFGSHHLVQHNDPSSTALQLGHATPLQTFSAYRRAVTRQQAEAYWSLRTEAFWPGAMV